MVFTKKQYEPWNKRNILIFETEILVQNDSFLEHGMPVFHIAKTIIIRIRSVRIKFIMPVVLKVPKVLKVRQ